MKGRNWMVMFFCFSTLIACSKGDEGETTNLTIANPSENRTEEQYRIDRVTVESAGSFWNTGLMRYTIANYDNSLVVGGAFSLGNLPQYEDVFYTSDRSQWRVITTGTSTGSAPFTRIINPWEHKESDSTFSITIESDIPGARLLKYSISGTIINVPI